MRGGKREPLMHLTLLDTIAQDSLPLSDNQHWTLRMHAYVGTYAAKQKPLHPTYAPTSKND